MKSRSRQNILSYVAAGVLFVAMLAVLITATSRLSASTEQQGLDTTYDAIRSAAVLCYATEGFYPPSLAYIEERYGVQIDYDNYFVRYEATASNRMPAISVYQK